MAADSPLRRACAAADALTGVPGARLYRGRIASPAGFADTGDASPEDAAANCAARLSLTGTPFSDVETAGGYLNFTLSEGWFRALPSFWTETHAGAARDALPFSETPVRDAGFPSSYVPFDRRFLAALGQRENPAVYARQDAGNPGWLVRYTLRRLAFFRRGADEGESAAASAPDCPLSRAERELLLLAAELPGLDGRRRARGVLTLCRAVWAVTPQKLGALSLETAERALRDALARCAEEFGADGET